MIGGEEIKSTGLKQWVQGIYISNGDELVMELEGGEEWSLIPYGFSGTRHLIDFPKLTRVYSMEELKRVGDSSGTFNLKML